MVPALFARVSVHWMLRKRFREWRARQEEARWLRQDEWSRRREEDRWQAEEAEWSAQEQERSEADQAASAEVALELTDQLWRDRDQPGSRFYTQPGLAVLSGKHGTDPSGYDGDSGDAAARVDSAFGASLEADAELGTPRVGDASYGRGAAGWTAVVEWIVNAAGQGVVGTIAAAPILLAAKRFTAYWTQTRDRGAKVLVNRGGAALIALNDVVQHAAASDRLWLEAAEEMSSVAGRPLSELNHVGTDPWLVTLVDPERGVRHVRVLSPDGTIRLRGEIPLSEFELLYLPIP